jgi:hypothetical protein
MDSNQFCAAGNLNALEPQYLGKRRRWVDFLNVAGIWALGPADRGD